MPTPSDVIPVVDVSGLVSEPRRPDSAAAAIRDACRERGFFYVANHGVDEALQARLEDRSREFFARGLEWKRAIRMELGGRAWRGYFAVGDELTSGKPDQKEGIYFGAELPDDDPRVLAGLPLHGRNLFPDIPGFRETVLGYMDAMTALGHRLMEGLAIGLGLDAGYFEERYTRDPLVLFRIFHYPALGNDSTGGCDGTGDDTLWSVGEHTDYGILTILRQDATGGLQVKSRARWIDAPPLPGTFVCNIGDMLERMTGGRCRSTPHRVRNSSSRGRLSFPFFFDPSFDAEVRPVEIDSTARSGLVRDDRAERWDGRSVHEITGTYGDYLLEKVSKVFPELGRDVL